MSSVSLSQRKWELKTTGFFFFHSTVANALDNDLARQTFLKMYHKKLFQTFHGDKKLTRSIINYTEKHINKKIVAETLKKITDKGIFL